MHFSIANVDENSTAVAEVPLKFDVTIDYKGRSGADARVNRLKLYYGGEMSGRCTRNGEITYTAQSPRQDAKFLTGIQGRCSLG